MAESKRKAISKKLRFEVLKRDNFTCQYCGAKAPDAILEVDHIQPVAKGGKNNILNLITACRSCNSGKSDRLLSDASAVEKQRQQAEIIQARREMIQLMAQWQQELLEEENEQIDMIERLFSSFWTSKSLTESGRAKIRSWIKRFGYQEVREAVYIACEQYDEPEDAFNKIGGICYNRKIGRGADYYL